MSNTINLQVRDLKDARKTFKFWHKVLLCTELMDDPEHRKEFQSGLDKLKKTIKQIKSGS